MKRKRESLADQIVIEFIENIDKGLFTYGEKLPSHEELAKYFDVSRVVVREALNELAVHGIVYFHQGKGTYIKSREEIVAYPPEIMQFTFNSSENILSILEARRVIEKEVCILAAQNRDEEDCENIESLYQLMIKNQDDAKLYSKYDLEFHTAIAKASKNPVLVQLLYMIKDLYQDEKMIVFSIPGILVDSTYAHGKICQAILDKDSFKAGKIMEEHIKIVENILHDKQKLL